MLYLAILFVSSSNTESDNLPIVLRLSFCFLTDSTIILLDMPELFSVAVTLNILFSSNLKVTLIWTLPLGNFGKSFKINLPK